MNTFKMIYDILKDAYEDCDISDFDLDVFADYLAERIFCDECPLNEVLSLVYLFEEEQRDGGVEIEVGREGTVYAGIIHGMERNAKNAKRLYKSFLEYHDLLGFRTLMDDFGKWLSKEEHDKVLEIAKRTFLKLIWEQYE